MANKLKINLEELALYEVDLDEVPFDFGALSEEERKEIDAFNDKYIEEVLQPELMRNVGPCPCRMPEIMERHARKSALLQNPNSINNVIEITQEDVDAWKFSAVLYMVHGKYTDIKLIVRECRKCHSISFWGDSEVFVQLMAESITRLYNVKNPPVASDIGNSYGDSDAEVLKAMGLDPDVYALEIIGVEEVAAEEAHDEPVGDVVIQE